MRPAGAAVSKATLGKVRRMLVERLPPEALNPFARTPQNEALLRSTLHAICAEPELDLGINPVLIIEIEAAICGLGPLQPLVDDPEVADILVNAPDAVFVERSGRLQPTDLRLADARELIELAERIAALAGRELSVAHPVVDARMPDGSRVNAVIPPVGGPYLSIRKFNRLRLDLVPSGSHGRSWVEAAGMSPEAADFLIDMVAARANFLVAGETGAGKTTLLRSLTDCFGPGERVGVVEDTAELALENANRFNLETLHPTDLGRADADSRLLDVGDLVANALRMRPDRLIVGEIRLPKEAFYTLQALHTGHDGSATTIHASSAEDALFRLELLARQSMRDLSGADLRAYIARVFDMVVVLRRLGSGQRIVHQIAALDGLDEDGDYRLIDVFRAELDSTEHLRWLHNPEWHPPERLQARMQLEGRPMELIGAFATGIAVFAALMALLPDRRRPTLGLRDRLRAWRRRRVAAAAELLAQARLELAPRSYLLLTLAAPVLLGVVGLLLSPVMAIIGAGVGLWVPRWYVRWLVGNESRAADDDAPRVLRAMVHRAGAGGTYPELFAAAADGARHRWVRADFEELLSRYYANEPPKDALAVIRRRQAGRNLALLYDALYVLTATGQPAVAAAEVLAELGEATRSNQSIAREAAAESRGLRIQALVLAVVIPLLFVYLLLVNPELVAPVTDTALGRFVLLPGAALLEVVGVWLSLRVARLEA